MIRLSRFVSSSEYTKDINITEAVLNFASGLLSATNRTGDVSSSGRISLDSLAKSLNFKGKELASVNLTLSQIEMIGGFVFEISTYELHKEEKDWAGTILAVAIGIASIYTGLWLINLGASGIFGATLGSSLVMQGAGDLVQSLISVGTGNPIDLKGYFDLKGMTMGISLATAGTLHFLNMIPAIQGLGFLQAGADGIFNAAQSPGVLLATTMSAQAATAAASIGLQSLGKNLIDPEHIEAKAEESIDRILAPGETREALARIYATDLLSDNRALQESLYTEIDSAIAKERSRFHDDKTTAGVGFGTNILSHAVGGFGSFLGIHNFISSGVQLTMGLIQNSEAMGHVDGATRGAIRKLGSQTLSTGEMMERLLVKDFRNDGVGNELYGELKNQGYVQGGEINYRNCEQLSGISLDEKFAKYKEAIVGNCKKIGDLLLNPGTFSELRQRYVSSLKGLKIDIQRSEIVAPIAGAAAGQFGQVVGEKVGQYVSNKIKEGKFGGGRGKVNQEEIAEKSGLNKKPETGEDAGQGEGQQGRQSPGESPGWKPVEREILVATDGSEHEHVGGGIRTEGRLGDSGRENVEYIASKMHAEIDGKEYVVFKASKRILGEDGRNIKREEIWVEAIELRNGDDFESIESGFAVTDSSRHRVSGSININSGGGLEGLKPRELGKIQAEMHRAFASNTQNGQSEHFNILMGNDKSNPQFLEGTLPIKGVEMKIADVQESWPPAGGMMGPKFLTMEDLELIGEYFSSEEFKVYLSDVGQGFVTGFVDMRKDALDLAKIIAKYGLEPQVVTAFRIALAVHEFQAANAGREWEVVKEGAFKAAKEVWRDIVETTTTGKGHGRILAEATAGFGIGRAVKGLKIAGKVVNEVMDSVPDVKVCPREFGLVDEGLDSVTKFKMGDHSPIVPGGGLQGHESLKFHTIDRHIEKSLEYLKTRFIENPKMKYASTFYDRAIAEKAISKALDGNKVKLDDWLHNSIDKVIEIDFHHQSPIGIHITRDSDIVEHIYTFRIVLEKDITDVIGYKIKTAYPKKL